MKKNEFTLNTTVLSGQCDSLMRFKAEAVLMSFQDVASRHAMFLGIDDFSLLEKDNAMWVVSKTKVKVNKLPLWNDEVAIRTWPMGAEGVRCNRCYQIIRNGEVMINAITEWVIIDATTRTLRKVETTSYPNDIDWITEKSVDERFRRFKDDFTENDFVKTLPNSIDTILKDDESISAGQKQLLTIARGMVVDAPFLILDEATSALDTESEKLVQQALERLMKTRTSIVIAHRLSTIKNADVICVMKDGEIVERGGHEELLAKNGAYSKLYTMQSF